jgi:hypothetical protein
MNAKVMVRNGLALGLILLSQYSALAQQSPVVQLHLSIKDGKDSFQTGEQIILVLAFTAAVSGYEINDVITEPASPVDQILLSPTAGVYRLLEDYSREGRYTPNYYSLNELLPGLPFTIKLPLNAMYRFDEPGRYTVRVITSRVSRSESADPKSPGALTSNEVSFDTVPMGDAYEAVRAKRLESLIRSAADLGTAQRYAGELMADRRSFYARKALFVSSPERVLSLWS